MIVQLGNKTLKASREEYQRLLQVASDFIPFGVYMVEGNGYAEFRKDVCKSMTQLKALIRQFKAEGLKVYYNGR